jgi:adenylosuccinate synthase
MAAVDIGIGPTKVDEVLVIYKAYTTRVGEGPQNSFITEENISSYPLWQNVLKDAEKKGFTEGKISDRLAKYLGEKGTVTHRQRRVGDFDYELGKYSAMINGATQIGITCLDKLFPECNKVQAYDSLSARAKEHVAKIEKYLGVKATLISTGPNPEDIVDLR